MDAMDYLDDAESIEKKLKQIELDGQYALELFEEYNMRHPIDGCPIYLSEVSGSNVANISLRQIIAKQLAQETLENGLTSSKITKRNSYCSSSAANI